MGGLGTGEQESGSVGDVGHVMLFQAIYDWVKLNSLDVPCRTGLKRKTHPNSRETTINEGKIESSKVAISVWLGGNWRCQKRAQSLLRWNVKVPILLLEPWLKGPVSRIGSGRSHLTPVVSYHCWSSLCRNLWNQRRMQIKVGGK
jgi:hypothetical protein